MAEDKFRPYTVLVANDDFEVEEMHSTESRADAIDRESDLRMEQLANRQYKWMKVAPTDEVEEEL